MVSSSAQLVRFIEILLKTVQLSLFQANLVKRVIPLLDRVLIQRSEALIKTKGGIVIPEKAQSKVLRGTVVAVGPGARNTVSS